MSFVAFALLHEQALMSFFCIKKTVKNLVSFHVWFYFVPFPLCFGLCFAVDWHCMQNVYSWVVMNLLFAHLFLSDSLLHVIERLNVQWCGCLCFILIYQGLTDTKIGGTSNLSYQASMSVLRVPSQSQLSHAYSQNSLHRSVSQLIDTQDKKSWDADLHGTDSGMVR